MPDRAWETDFTSKFHHAPYDAISPTNPSLSTAGKTVLITGGGRGIGLAITTAFSQSGAAHIVITGRTRSSLVSAAEKLEAEYPKTKFTVVEGDVSKREDVARAFAAAGKVDVVVANAGYLASIKPVGEDDEDDWWRVFEVNVRGTHLLARHFLASANPGAAFISVNAGAGHLNPCFANFSSYASSKIAIARIIETLQQEEKARGDSGRGLRFYNVHPGVIRSEMLTKSGLEAFVDEDAIPADERECLASVFPILKSLGDRC